MGLLKDFSPKSQDAVALQDMSVALYLWLIGDIRQAIDRPLQYLGFTAGRWLWSSEHKADSLIANSKKRAERSERFRCMSRVTADYSLPAHIRIIIRLSWAVNHYRDNANTTKPSATKMPENWSWRTRQLLTCRCVSVMLLRSMQNTRRS